MREIEFRGKRLDNGEWVYGSLLVSAGGDAYIGTWLIKSQPIYAECGRRNGKTNDRFNGIGLARVDPETVGQYTGLKDKNGKKIFEGDIVALVFRDGIQRDIGTVKYGNFNCSCCDGVYGWYVDRHGDIRNIQEYGIALGNIYDNPELLRG